MIQVHRGWLDNMSQSPSECTFHFDYHGEPFSLYMRWRWTDPWEGRLIQGHDILRGRWTQDLFRQPMRHHFFTHDQDGEAKAKLQELASEWLQRNCDPVLELVGVERPGFLPEFPSERDRVIDAVRASRASYQVLGGVVGYELARQANGILDLEILLERRYEEEDEIVWDYHTGEGGLDQYWEYRIATLQIEFVYQLLLVVFAPERATTQAAIIHRQLTD